MEADNDERLKSPAPRRPIQHGLERSGGALPRGDSDLRLVVNRELARLFRSGDISEVMNHWFGALGGPSLLLTAMVYLNSIPE
jgi:ABC-type amino acid transport substrate-binding protein